MGENKIKALEGPMALWISQIFLNIDEPDIQISENWLQKAIGADQKNGQRWNLSTDYIIYTELFKRKKEKVKAKKSLSQAIELYQECGADVWVKKYKKELAEL